MHGPVLAGNMAVCQPKGVGGEGTGSVEGDTENNGESG